MPARSPEEICDLFQKHMAAGDIESLLSLYDPEAVFLNQSREVKSGQGLRQELAPMAAGKINFTFKINQIIRAGRHRIDAHPLDESHTGADLRGCS